MRLLAVALLLTPFTGCDKKEPAFDVDKYLAENKPKTLEERCPRGHALILHRGARTQGAGGVHTFRACFDNAADCGLVSKHMNQAEPLSWWYCR